MPCSLPPESGSSLQSSLILAWRDNTHHLLLMFSWDLQSDVEEPVPLESGGLMSSTWGREGWEGEKPLCGEDGVRTTEPGRLLASVSVPEPLLPCRVGVPAQRTESPPSLASCFLLRYSSRDTCKESTAMSQGKQGTRWGERTRLHIISRIVSLCRWNFTSYIGIINLPESAGNLEKELNDANLDHCPTYPHLQLVLHKKYMAGLLLKFHTASHLLHHSTVRDITQCRSVHLYISETWE